MLYIYIYVFISESSKHEHPKGGHYHGNLPDTNEDFTGREDNCKRILSCLETSQVRLVLLCAPTGFGKTAVVSEVAHELVSLGHTVIYTTSRNVYSVDDLACSIIEIVDPQRMAGDNPVNEALGILKRQPNGTILVIENFDDMIHIQEDQRLPFNTVVDETVASSPTSSAGPTSPLTPNSTSFRFGRRMSSAPAKRTDFFNFIGDVGKSVSCVKMLITSTEQLHFIDFRSEIHSLEPLSTKDSMTFFKKREPSLTDDVARQLADWCKGIPLILCVLAALLQNECAEDLIQRLSSLTRSPQSLLEELGPESLPDNNRITYIFEVCFNRLSETQKALLVTLAVFPFTFSLEEVQKVATSMKKEKIEGLLLSLIGKCVLRLDRRSKRYSLQPFVRAFCLTKTASTAEDEQLKTKFTEARSAFISHYIEKLARLDEDFFSKKVKSSIVNYRLDKYNIKQALIWCAEEPDMNQQTRVWAIDKANEAAVFLSKVMRRQEFEELFTKMAYYCSQDKERHSECFTNLGAKMVLSCMCQPLCERARRRACFYLEQANEIQTNTGIHSTSARAQCLSKLGRCYGSSGKVEKSFELLNEALTIRRKRLERNKSQKDQVMLATCFNDLAGITTLRIDLTQILA